MTNRQDPSLGVNPAAFGLPGIQTAPLDRAPLIFAQEFQRGGRVAIGGNRPSAQQWAGPAPSGLADWQVWDIDGLIVQPWIDAYRQAAMLELTGGGLAPDAFSFAGLFLPAPTRVINEDTGGFTFTLYSRVRQISNDINFSFDNVEPNFFGPFVAFDDITDGGDGKFVAGGISYYGPQGFAAMACNFIDHETLAEDPFVLAGQFLNIRIRCELTNVESPLTGVFVEVDRDGMGYVPIGGYLQNGFPTFVGLGGFTPNNAADQGATFAAEYLRAYDATLLGERASKLVIDSGRQQIG